MADDRVMEDPAVLYRVATGTDVQAIVRLFRECKPYSIWAQLGERTAGIYFRFYCTHPVALGVVAVSNGDVVGAALGMEGRPGRLHVFYRSNALRLLVSSVGDVVSQPKTAVLVAGRLWRAARDAARVGQRRSLGRGAAEEGEEPSSPLPDPAKTCFAAMVFVAPKARGRHVGSTLFREFNRHMAERGFEWAVAQTARENIASQRAQQRAGFTRLGGSGDELTFVASIKRLRSETAADVAVEVIRSLEELDKIAGAWNTLFAITPSVSGFQSLGWVRACCQELSRPGQELHVVLVRSGDRVSAIFPTQLEKGRLTFIGRGVSNYSGPLYDPEKLDSVVRAWIEHLDRSKSVKAVDLWGLRRDSPFFAAQRSRSPKRLSGPSVVSTNICPEVDLGSGWESLYGRHKSKQRSTWKRKERRLGALGDCRFRETTEPDEIIAALPRVASLFQERWRGQRISGGFSPELSAFHQATVRNSEDERYVVLSMLTLDDEMIAYSYGVRGRDVTASYLLAYDDRFQLYSVGLLLVMRVLEAAARRGDPKYDFSLGSAEYKALWATGEEEVYRLLYGRGRWGRSALTKAWVEARSVPWMRALKRQGLRALRGSPDRALGTAGGVLREHPSSETSWVYRLTPSPQSGRPTESWSYRDLVRNVSSDLVDIAVERNFRGDDLVVIPRLDGDVAGLVWRASPGRRDLVTGGTVQVDADEVVYYHPVTLGDSTVEELVLALPRTGECVLVSPRRLSAGSDITYVAKFGAASDERDANGSTTSL